MRRVAPTSVLAGLPEPAEPAVYVHGMGGASTNWTDLMALLRDRLDGVALDLPGFGHSPPRDDGDFTPFGHARSVIALIEAEFRAPVHLLGNSLGGTVALRVAADRPDLVRSLTLISPALPDLRLRRFTAGFVPLAAPVVGERIARALSTMDPVRRARQIIALCFADPTILPPEVFADGVAEIVRRRRLPYADDALLATLRGLVVDYLTAGQRSPWQQLPAVSAPALVIAGGRDRLVHPRVVARAAREIPEARLLVLPSAGHVGQMEHPELVARAVRELLDASGAGGRDHEHGMSGGRGTVEIGRKKSRDILRS